MAAFDKARQKAAAAATALGSAKGAYATAQRKLAAASNDPVAIETEREAKMRVERAEMAVKDAKAEQEKYRLTMEKAKDDSVKVQAALDAFVTHNVGKRE